MDRFSKGVGGAPLQQGDVMERFSKAVGGNPWGALTDSSGYHTSSDASLFSSSLPVLPHEKLMTRGKENGFQSIDYASSRFNGIQERADDNYPHEAVGAHEVQNMLPDDIMDDLNLNGLPCRLDDSEEYDFFGSGGMELDTNFKDIHSGLSKLGLSYGDPGNGMTQLGINGSATVTGEHPFGEHPSRTLFVRNINSNVEDSELKSLFEQHGDIRSVHTTSKNRGFVIISYYDIRDARTAMRLLQNKPLRRRKLDIHFCIPKDNPSDKDMNQGTLVVFNLDPSVSNDDLMEIFGVYGEVKEIRETPHKRHHKFIEYFDVRAAEAALRSLNRSDIAGKRIKLEPSRPGGARRNLVLQLNQDSDHDGTQTFQIQAASPLANSPPGNWGQFNSPNDHSYFHDYSKSPGVGTASPNTSSHSPGLVSILPPRVSNSFKIAPIGKVQGGNSTSLKPSAFLHSHSLPDATLSQHLETISSSFGASTSNGSAIETLSGPQFLWGSPKPQLEQSRTSAWPRPSIGHPLTSNGQGNSNPHSSHHGSFINQSLNHQNHQFHHNHHIGSAPSGIPLERHFGFTPELSETSYMNSAFRGMGVGHNERSFTMNMGNQTTMNAGFNISRNMPESGYPNIRMTPSPRLNPMFLSPGPYPGLIPTNMGSFSDRGRIRRGDSNENQMDTKRHYQLDLEKIISGEDTRTTLMIKNIPNKYTSKMLLAAIDEYNRGTYDFIYLPIDFKNKCNVGYAFINMLTPQHIIQFYKAIDGKKWEKFNSEKVASLAYARIQGKSALVTHFQNSSLMNEDKRCRPILFHSDGPEASYQISQEHLSSNRPSIPVRRPNGFQAAEDFLDIPTEAGSSIEQSPDYFQRG